MNPAVTAGAVDLAGLRGPDNVLAPDYSRFRVAERLLLSGHSHQAWPDVAERGLLDCFADAAEDVDAKWDKAFARAERLRDGVRGLLAEPAAQVALGGSTHDLVLRLLSALDLPRRPRLVTTDGEFHTLRRQLARLAEAGVELVRVPAAPADTLAERLAAAASADTAAVLVSRVLFETARIVPGLDQLAGVCRERGVELVVDAYHALGLLPMPIDALGLADAWVLGGGYKYLQLGEGNCFLRLPGHAERLRPVITGWYAEFGELADEPVAGRVRYAQGGDRFAGATYDPASHYRASAVLDYFAARGLTPEFLRTVALHQVGLLAAEFDRLDLPERIAARDRDTPADGFAGFLALRCPDAAGLQAGLAERGVRTDSRGEWLRFGPAPYLSDAQLTAAMTVFGEVARERLG